MSQSNNPQNDNILMLFQKLDKLEEKMDKKLEKLDTRVDSMDKELAIYNEQLKIHIEGVILTRQYIDLETRKLQRQLTPIADHVNKLQTAFNIVKKFGVYIVSISAFIYLVMQLLGLR